MSNSVKSVHSRSNRIGLGFGSAILAAVLLLVAAAWVHAAPLPTQFNHSFDVDPASVTVCSDGATFTGEAEQPSSLGLLMTAQVFNGAGTMVLATGNTHTFTATGETFLFTVMGSFTPGDTVAVTVTDVPGTLGGTEGDTATATVGNCTIAVPTMPAWGVGLLSLLLAAGGATLLRRGSRGAPAGAVRGFGIGAGLLLLLAAPASAQTLSKVFTPNTIGSGSVSTITFTITNNGGTPVTGLAFTDVLPTVPGDVDIADPANASTSCLDGVVSAPDGGGTISFSDGKLGAGDSCTVTVDVTAGTPGVHTNPAISLEFNESGGDPPSSLPVDLTVDGSLPGFSKSFAPSSVPLGAKSTLTFTIDNSDNEGSVNNLDFTDNLPLGMLIADPANASTTCGTATIPPTLTAVAGTGVVILDANGIGSFPAVAAGAPCTVTVEVVTTAAGNLDNVSSDLLADFVSAGKASATLEVTVTDLAIQKSYTDDPVPPGGTVTLEFRLDNFDRVFPATGVAFSDNIASSLSGLNLTGVLSNDCGGSVSGGGNIMFSGGTIAAESFCTIRLSLSVPGMATPGVYENVSEAVTGTVDGVMVTGNTASDDLYVEPAPVLTKEFLEAGTLNPDPVVDPGTMAQDVVIRFTVTNTSTTSGATDVEFIDELTDGSSDSPPDLTSGFLPFPVTVTLPPTPDPPCGAGSSLALVSVGTDRQGLELTGGSLAAAGMSGNSCTFDVTVEIPAGFPPGVYLNTTEEPSATVDGATRTGKPASDTLTVIGAPTLTKSFTDDPAVPGGTVTLEFELSHSPDASGDATGITFTDDLAPVLASLTATGLPIAEACDPDGPGGDPGTGTLSGSAGDTLLTFMDGTLSPGESCVVSVTLSVPAAAAPGNYVNTTSGVGATVDGVAATGPAASDTLSIAGLVFTKEFLTNPVIAGDTTILRFTVDNIHPSDDATIILFTDNLQADLPGLAATGPPSVNDCGGTLSGTTFLLYVGGVPISSGASCTIEVPVLVPLAAADGTYSNITSNLSATQGGSGVTVDPAIDELTVNSNLLQLTKEFTDDPVPPGDPVTLEFTLTNLDAANAASMIDFSDDLGAVLPGTPDLTFDSVLFDDCGGTVAGTGTDMITVTGASLGIGGSCTLRVSLTVPAGAAPGVYTNTTSDVTGTIDGFAVTGDSASDDLEIIQLLTFSKSFDGPTTATGTALLTFTITNPGTATATGISFSDDLDSVITGLIATSLPAVPCGAGSSITGIGFLTFTGGELPPLGGMCSFDVEVLVPVSATAGTYPNTTSDLFQSGLLVAEPATADLTVEPPPTFAKVFAPNPILAGGVSTLTFTIDNSASAIAASDLAFTDDLPAGVVIANPTNASTTCGGMGNASPGSASFNFAGGTVGAVASCTVQFDVTAALPGTYVNTSGDLTSSSGDSGTATDTLTVLLPPAFSKVFAPDTIGVSNTTTLTFTIENTASPFAATALDFTDALPAGLEVAAAPGVVNTCGGTVTATAASTTISLTSGAVGAGVTCALSVDVTAVTEGSKVNTTGDLTSSSGNSGTATDTLTVLLPPAFTKVFTPDSIVETFTTTLVFTIDNTGSSFAATDLDFLDMLPMGLEVAAEPNVVNACGGSVVAAAGSVSISLSNGTVGAGASCTLSVDIAGLTQGTKVNTTGDLTSSSGNSGTATDTLEVTGCPAANGLDFTVPDGVVLTSVAYEACRTITVPAHTLVLGPNGKLTLTAGVSVVFLDGVEFGQGGLLEAGLDPSLTMP